MIDKLFQVIYLWRGERHRDSHVYANVHDAVRRCDEVIALGFVAFVERVQ